MQIEVCLARHVQLEHGERNRSVTYVGTRIMTRNNKEQGKVVPAYTNKAFGNIGIHPLIPNLGTGWD
jgi:hypothetical protein